MKLSKRLLLLWVASAALMVSGCKTSPSLESNSEPEASTSQPVEMGVEIVEQTGKAVSGAASQAILRFEAGDQRREMRVFLPSENDGRRSLLVLFHGLGDSAENFALTLNAEQLAEKLRVIVAVPQGLKNPNNGPSSWNAGVCCAFGDETRDDASLLPAIKNAVAELTEFDQDVVDVAGFSNGGFFAEYLACKHSDQVRGVLNVGGNQPVPNEECVLSSPVNVVRVHGTDDDRVPHEGGSWRGRELPSLEQNFVAWRERLGCSRAPQPSNYGAASCRQQFDCKNGSLELCSVYGMGHTWPSDRATGLDVFHVAWQVWNRPLSK